MKRVNVYVQGATITAVLAFICGILAGILGSARIGAAVALGILLIGLGFITYRVSQGLPPHHLFVRYGLLVIVCAGPMVGSIAGRDVAGSVVGAGCILVILAVPVWALVPGACRISPANPAAGQQPTYTTTSRQA